jgi:hypothetical protein
VLHPKKEIVYQSLLLMNDNHGEIQESEGDTAHSVANLQG